MALRTLVNAVTGRLAQLRKYGGTWSALGRGLRLLLQGRVRTFLARLIKGQSGPHFDHGSDYDADQAYAAWRQQRLQKMVLQHITDKNPLITVIVRIGPGADNLESKTGDSLRLQTYPRWQYLKIDNGAGVRGIHAVLAQAQGEFVLFLDAGDELADHALFSLARSIVADPTLDLITTDHDQIDASGHHGNPHFLPGWSPETLLTQPSLVASAAMRAALVVDLGGLRAECADLAVYDLVLRIAARTPRVQHLPDILLHRHIPQDVGGDSFTALTRVLTNHLAETGRAAVIERLTHAPGHRVRFQISGAPVVSILIPTAFARRKGTANCALIVDCLRSIRLMSSWKSYEIIVMASSSVPADVHAEFAASGVKLIASPRPFNFAAAINAGAGQAEGSQLLLLNDDTEVITPDWLECMLEYAQQPDIGAVGARLLFPHGRVQHTGLHLLDGKPVHAFYAYPAEDPGYLDSMNMPRNYLAVTGACLMTRREVFEQLGGLDVCFPLDCNDIDYCLRVVATGRRIVCTPYAQLLHHEAFTRSGMDTKAYAAFKARWGGEWQGDPYYNRNFSRGNANYQIDPAVRPKLMHERRMEHPIDDTAIFAHASGSEIQGQSRSVISGVNDGQE